jgi:hypothetical protein
VIFASTGTAVITDVNLTLGGHRVDSFMQLNSIHDSVVDYMRLFFFNQMSGTPFSNSISYDMFLQSYYICSFDFTTGQNSNYQFLTPSTRFGHLRVEVSFSDHIPEELMMICLEEYPAQLTINHAREIGFSYLNTTAT